MRLCPAVLLLCAAVAPMRAEEPPVAVPLLDIDAIDPEDEPEVTAIEEPVLHPDVELPEQSLSASKQFLVSGGDGAQRASLAIEAENVRSQFNRLLGLREPPVVMPIEILLYGQMGGEPRKRRLAYELRFTPDTFLLRIHVDLSKGIDRNRMERAVITGLIIQRSLSDVNPGPLDAPVLVPVWLVEGLREAEKWAAGRGDRKLYEGVFQQQNLFLVEDLLAINEGGFERLDGASRAAFRVLSGALVMALLEQPDAATEFLAFCDEVARFEGEMPILLRRHFPELNLSERSLAKWWTLTLAKLADAPLTEVMPIDVTEKVLEEALVIHYRDGEGVTQSKSFESWREFDDLKSEARYAAIRPAQDALGRLSYRCFPSYRALLFDYQERLLDWAGENRLGKLDVSLVELSEMRVAMLQRALRARDYLDYMEIAGATELSGSFTDYLELKEELKERPRAERGDSITKYLDTLEKIYDRPRRRR